MLFATCSAPVKGSSARHRQVPPLLALHASNRFAFAFDGVKFLVAYCYLLDKHLVRCFWIGKGEHGMCNKLVGGASIRRLDPPCGDDGVRGKPIDGLHFSHSIRVSGVEREGDVIDHYVI